ncbi:acyltransferase [Nocardioides nanhaiensis]|uniref:Acyltransferase n=2 Tax=Nocardioides nanhaiensis TaxID=1476871 RepID=A0ABP8WSR9_9ACTN
MLFGVQSMGEAFERRPNALNGLRLGLALVVLLWHSILLTDRSWLSWPLHQLLEEVPVDAFFAVSGFLLARSWTKRPRALEFALARASRLLPGLWLCLALTAAVIAPVVAPESTLRDRATYALGNAGVYMSHRGLAEDGQYLNLSLWSLWWECCCYASMLVLGSRRALTAATVAAIACVLWSWLLVLTVAGVWSAIPGTLWVSAVPRLGLMFALGALIWLVRARVPVSGNLAAVASVVLFSSLLMPNYHLLGAPSVAYLCLWASLAVGARRWARPNVDLSYGTYLYGFPLQVVLVRHGVDHWVPLTLAAAPLATAMAWISWKACEAPALRWMQEHRRPRRREPSGLST